MEPVLLGLVVMGVVLGVVVIGVTICLCIVAREFRGGLFNP